MCTTSNANNARIIWYLVRLAFETKESPWSNVANPRGAARRTEKKNADCTRH